MNNYRATLWAVIGFGVLMLAIAIGLSGASRLVNTTGISSVHDLYGTWRTRTVAEDNLNGAYSGTIHFARGYYEVQNDLVNTPIRIDGIQYRLAGDRITIGTNNNFSRGTEVQLLSRDHATIQLPGGLQVLYMYRSH